MNAINPIHDENIRVTAEGVFVRAPRRPFPWWGPFDACNAIGRFLVLLVLVLLACVTLSIINEYIELRARPWQRKEFAAEWVVGMSVFILILAVLMTPALGILFRKKWSIVYVKILLVVLSILTLLAGEHNISIREDEEFVIAACVIPAILILWFSIVVTVWLFLKDPHTIYYFSHIPLEKLEKNPFSATKRLVIPIFFLGLSVFAGIFCCILLPFTHPLRYSFSKCAWPIFWGSISTGAFLVLALAFLKRWKAARLIFFANLVLLLITTIITIGYFILKAYAEENLFGGPGFDLQLQILSLTIFISFTPILYIISELFRYIRTDKFRAWCDIEKNYIPPWQAQVELVRTIQEGDAHEPANEPT